MMRIRKFEFDKDIDAIIPLDRDIMGNRTEKIIKEYYKNYVGEIYVAEENGEIVGYISLSYPHWNRVAYIDHLAVLESKRNMGIGKKLVEKVEGLAKMKGARILAVATALWNIKGIDFYKREGFHLRALLPDWFGKDNDLVWLDKRIAEDQDKGKENS